MATTQDQVDVIRALIAENPKATNKQLAETAGVAMATIHRIRHGKGRHAPKKHLNGRKIREVPGYKAMSETLKQELIEANREIRSLRVRISELEGKYPGRTAKLNGGLADPAWRDKTPPSVQTAVDNELEDFMAFRDFKRRQGRGVIK